MIVYRTVSPLGDSIRLICKRAELSSGKTHFSLKVQHDSVAFVLRCYLMESERGDTPESIALCNSDFVRYHMFICC